MILQSIKELTDKINMHQAAQKSDRIAEVIQSMENRIKPIANNIETVAGTYNTFKKNKLIDEETKIEIRIRIDTIAKFINECGDKVKNNPELFHGDNNYNEFVVKIQDFEKELTALCKNQWTKEIEKNSLRPEQKDQLDVFFKVNEYKSKIEKLKKEIGIIENKKNSLPRNENDITSIIIMGDQLKKGYGELGFDDLPPNIANFLKNASQPDGADPELLNDEVLKWLRDKEVLSQYRIKPRESVLRRW